MHNAGKMIHRIAADWNRASRMGPASPVRVAVPKTATASTIARAAAAAPAAAADHRAPINSVSSSSIGVSASATRIVSGRKLDRVGRRAIVLEAGQIIDGDPGDLTQRLGGEERLMAGNQHVG